MRVLTRSIVCERVRGQISLRLDGELSELESRMLESHVARCGECAAYEADVVSLTAWLREAPLEPLEHPIVLRKPSRRVSVAQMQVGVAAALAVAVLGVVAQLGPGQSVEPASASPTRYATYDQLTREVKQIIANGRLFQKGSGSALPL
jgi:predicted anti-sigma-YlaC factor YlaD